jgi:two-component system, NtrC family, sensor kinase
VSEEVYDKVLENGLNWYDRAFVVNDWYLSAYDPIHDVEGKVLGILYVGVLAKQYDDLKKSLWKLYGTISLAVGLFVLAVGLVFARRLTGSISGLADAARTIAEGNLDLNVREPKTDDEVKDLTRAFNVMAARLKERDEGLRRANTALEEANRSLQVLNKNYLDMLGFVSHELKNSLGVIYTSARALDAGLVGPMSEPQTALTRNIARTIEGAVKMTRNYLDLARIEKGELRVRPEWADMIKDIVNPVLEELEPMVNERKVTIEKTLPDSISVYGDAALLKIAYRNLLDNALKYGNQGGKVRLGFEEKDGMHQFEIWNEGQGLTKEQLPRLFEKFARFNTPTESSRSTGLGLFITRDIVTKHEGRIWADSETGQWMRFRFVLPRKNPGGGDHGSKKGAGHR